MTRNLLFLLLFSVICTFYLIDDKSLNNTNRIRNFWGKAGSPQTFQIPRLKFLNLKQLYDQLDNYLSDAVKIVKLTPTITALIALIPSNALIKMVIY